MQRKNLHVRLNRDFSRHAEEILAILPRVVGYTSNHPLLVQQVVGERRNRTYMNSAEHQHAAFLQRLLRPADDLSAGFPDNRVFQLLRWLPKRSARPGRSQ